MKILISSNLYQKLQFRHFFSDRLLEQLWEFGAEPPSNVVAAQICLLRRQLAKYGCDEMLETIYGLGYRFKKLST